MATMRINPDALLVTVDDEFGIRVDAILDAADPTETETIARGAAASRRCLYHQGISWFPEIDRHISNALSGGATVIDRWWKD